ncbi:MAG: hypothetical protein A3K83_05540 [Omnitrophica WOR_2 bacterium RBG_13_44_8b]|nr:MAG: hypothetical protein A3K83_05540 [Omnitrophica WOR_2 bacterium RBG_13_44_8b]
MPLKVTVIFLLVLLVVNLDCYAAPCYGTKLPQKSRIFIGIQSYSVFKRYLKDDFGKLRSQQEFFLLSYGIFDWLSLDLKGGAGFIKQHPVGGDEQDYPTFLGGGYGFRLKLYEKKNTRMVFGFQHISIHPKTISIAGAKHKAVLDDWQFCALVSYDFKKLTPYLGARWSRLDYIHWIDGNRKLEASDLNKSAGLILGLDVPVTKKAWFNLEGNFFDSEALALSLNYSF